MKYIFVAFIAFFIAITDSLSAREFYVGGFFGADNASYVGMETADYESFLSYSSSTFDADASTLNTSAISIGYLFKDKIDDNFSFVYGGSFGLLTMQLGTTSYSGSSISILTGVKYEFTDKLSCKLLISPFSTGELSTTESGSPNVKVSNLFSTLFGISYKLPN